MNLKFKEISQSEFSDFTKNFAGDYTFHQSLNYGQFREQCGETIFYKGIFAEKKLLAIALIQKVTTRIKTYLHCPHGPLIINQNEDIFEFFLQKYKELGQQQQCDFVRLSPLFETSTDIKPVTLLRFKKVGYRPAPIHMMNPEHTLTLDLTQSEEDMLAHMKKSTRYEVRRVQKCGIEVKQGNSNKDFQIFWDLHMKTVARQGFIPFPKKNTERELAVFGENALFFSAFIKEEDQRQYYSSSLILFDKHSAYYHQGSSVYSKLPVAHATIWAAMLEAKKRGCQTFNFWGIVDDTMKSHPWYGLSRFKRGFGGTEHKYVHCHDCPLTWKYHLSSAIEKWRRWRRAY